MTRMLLVALALLAALAPAARAGEPFTIGEGRTPHLLVDNASGMAHVAWTEPTLKKLKYCQVPRGATACSLERTIDPPAESSDPSAVFLVRGSGSTLLLVMPHYASGKTHVYTSSDGGSTWPAPLRIYARPDHTDPTEPILNAAGNALVIGAGNPSRSVFSARLDASEKDIAAQAILPAGGTSGMVYNVQVQRFGGDDKLVAVADNLDTAAFWTAPTDKDPSDTLSWTGPTAIGDSDEIRLAGDGTNVYLLSSAGPSGSRRQEVRKWNGSTFGSPVTAAAETGYINDIAVGGSGAVGAIWRLNDTPTNRLRFALSTDGGATFAATTIAREDSGMTNMEVALASDNRGWAAYEGKNPPDTGARSYIRLVNTDTVPEPAKTPPPTTTPPPTPKPTATPAPTLSKLTRRVAGQVPGATLSLGVPRGCIPAGVPFVATLTWKKQKRKGNVFVKVNRTDFFVGAKRLKIDRKAPFRQTLRIPSPKAGQSYKLRARAFIKVRRGRAPKKSISTTLRVCG